LNWNTVVYKSFSWVVQLFTERTPDVNVDVNIHNVADERTFSNS